MYRRKSSKRNYYIFTPRVIIKAIIIISYTCGPERKTHNPSTQQSNRESLCWIRMTRTARQDARRSGKEDAGHSLFWKMSLRILRGTQ